MSQDDVIKLPQPGEVCSTPVGGIAFRNRGAVVPFATRLDELAGRDRCRMADDGDEIALAARLYAQKAEAVLAFSRGFEL
ncbi:MAG: hypothetical protein WA624_19255 [Methylocella sp.]